MKIEVGKFYKTRDGRKAHITRHNPNAKYKDSEYEGYTDGGVSYEWTSSGIFHVGHVGAYDLVAPWTAEDETKRRKEAGEPPFKVGDRVECIRYGLCKVGTPGTVESVHSAHNWFGLVEYPQHDQNFFVDNYKLVTEAPPEGAPQNQYVHPAVEDVRVSDRVLSPEEVQELRAKSGGDQDLIDLVRRANDGEHAREKLSTLHRERVERRAPGRESRWKPMTDVIKSEFRIKPAAPAFEPFSIWVEENGQQRYREVSLVGDEVKIGCQTFTEVWLRTSLAGLCKQGVTQSNGMVPLVATRTGVRHGGNEISWADADKLLAALEKAQVKP